MQITRGFARLTAMVLSLSAATALHAQSWGETPPEGVAAFNRSFGGAGLLPEFTSNETYGVVQSRINLQYGHQSAAASSGVTTGYQDDTSSFVLPLVGMWTLPDNNSFVRVTGAFTYGEGAPNLTYTQPTLGSLTVQYLRMVDSDTAWAVGAVVSRGHTELLHNDGSVDSSSIGLRVDALHGFSPNWGIVARALVVEGQTDTTIPLGFADLRSIQDRSSTYVQADLVGNFRNNDFSIIPQGWVVNPVIGIAAQRTQRDATTNSLGAPVAASVDDYAILSTSVKMSRPAFQPGTWSPTFELGIDHELANDLGEFSDEPTYLYGKVGAGVLINRDTFFNVSYARSEGLNGNRSSQALTMVLSHNF